MNLKITLIIAAFLSAYFVQPSVSPVPPRPSTPDVPPDVVPPPPPIEAVNYVNMRNIGRVPRIWEDGVDIAVYWTPQKTYDKLYERMSNPLYNRCLLHMPQGWIYTMSSGGWDGVDAYDGPGRSDPEEFQKMYASLIGRILVERPGYKVTLYTGGQFYSAYSIYGRPRDGTPANRFIAEPDWIDPDDPQTVRGIRDLTVQPWADIGVTGVVFDSGSKFPADIVKWKEILADQMKTVGLEAIPWIGSTTHGRIDWTACEAGVEYHANQRYRRGRPFLETVPMECRGRAFVWLVHMLDPPPTARDVADMMHRGWTPIVLWRNDELYQAALVIYNAG